MKAENQTRNRKTIKTGFCISLAVIAVLAFIGVLKTNDYNSIRHHDILSGAELFAPLEGKPQKEVSINGTPRTNTWTKVFDLYNEGLTEHNFQAYIYDFAVTNNTSDDVADFTYTLSFDRDVFLASAWNGSVEVHQHIAGEEVVAIIPDLREFVPGDYELRTITIDGEPFIHMCAGDSVVYIPNRSKNAIEVPIKPTEGTTSGIILYVRIGETLEGSSLDFSYTFHRGVLNEPLFLLALGGLILWLIALLNYAVTSAHIRKYQKRHEQDNKIIRESIGTFTGFIDAKDPYTNGHSLRVAQYTRMIAAEMGYKGEELDRIYYVALLHDCGKIGVPDHILGKPGRLTDEEFSIMKSHTSCGGDVLDNFKSLENAGEGALYHHERYDGKGYPKGLAGQEIPLIARIICVADAFDAMNKDRVYRKKLSKERIIRELQENAGSQFDPEIADIMLRLLGKGKIEM